MWQEYAKKRRMMPVRENDVKEQAWQDNQNKKIT